MNDSDSLKDYRRVRRLAIRALFDIIEQSGEGTVIVDKDARIVWINDRYVRRFGLEDASRVVGQPCEKLIPGSLLRQVACDGKPILLDMMDTAKDPLVVTHLPLHDDVGGVIGAIGLALFDEPDARSPLLKRYLSLQQELASARSLLRARQDTYSFAHFIGTGALSLEVKRRARRSASADSPVLLLGETGTGKELLAHAIHNASPRAGKPFVSINSAAIPEASLEAEFFGTAQGVFSGAERRGRHGKFHLAEGGTLFLDEIGDLPLPLQNQLLRVLQEQAFAPVGAHQRVKSNVRLIAATSTDLEAAIKRGEFRAELFDRLSVIPIKVPPLRERLDDLPALSEAFLEELRSQHELAPEAANVLAQHAWPGNVRELRNVLERAALLSDDSLLNAYDIRAAIGTLIPLDDSAPQAAAPVRVETYTEARQRFDRSLIQSTLAECGGSVVLAARQLGLGRSTLYKKMAALGIMES
jgi:transcriptional regulator with PAS, ATPase and Fis domain